MSSRRRLSLAGNFKPVPEFSLSRALYSLYMARKGELRNSTINFVPRAISTFKMVRHLESGDGPGDEVARRLLDYCHLCVREIGVGLRNRC